MQQPKQYDYTSRAKYLMAIILLAIACALFFGLPHASADSPLLGGLRAFSYVVGLGAIVCAYAGFTTPARRRRPRR